MEIIVQKNIFNIFFISDYENNDKKNEIDMKLML